jgi:hypothetical protein
MPSVYRGLLYLYPSHYRREYGDEMICVFQDAQADTSAAGITERTAFQFREICGLLAGAMREHIRIINGSYPSISITRFNMRSEFRFPRSTVFLMAIIFAGVILAMEKANTIQLKYAAGAGSIWPSLPWFLGFAFLFTWATALIILGIRFAMGRSGVHRITNIEAGSNRMN